MIYTHIYEFNILNCRNININRKFIYESNIENPLNLDVMKEYKIKNPLHFIISIKFIDTVCSVEK